MEQKVKWAMGASLAICITQIDIKTKGMNKEGFELTGVTIQSKNNNPEERTEAVLVFTKK